MVRALNIFLAVILSLIMVSPAQADRTFFAAYQLVAGATALGNLTFTANLAQINKADNTGYLALAGGTSYGTANGGNIEIAGISHASTGSVTLYPANIATGHISNVLTHASSLWRVRSGTSTLWSINTSGQLAQDATNGSDLVFSKVNTGVRGTVATGISAAGSASGDATVISSEYNNVSTATAGQGVRLQSFPVGMTVFVRNQSANAFNLYPPTGGNILGYGTDAAASLAVNATAICKIQTALFVSCAEAPNL